MTLEEIRELLKYVIETGVAELEVQRGQDKVRIRRTWANDHAVARPEQSDAGPPPSSQREPTNSTEIHVGSSVPQSSSNPSAASTTGIEQVVTADDPSVHVVRSPIVGTFYEAPSPGAPPFVKEGDTVEPGQVLCIIESMKLMNEVECEVAGVVLKKLVENGQPVEYGQSLFLIRKTG